MIPGSWQTVSILALLACIAAGSAICFRPKKRNRLTRRQRKIRRVSRDPSAAIVKEPAKPYVVADYSAQYQKMVAWLGPRFLLARPINRPAASNNNRG
jgi:hypothetical protein